MVTVQVDGHPVELILDTGATASRITAAAAREAGLSVHAMGPRTHAVSGDAALGPLQLGRMDFVTLSPRLLSNGVLGLDVLSRYRLQVVHGERLALRPRGDTWEAARERIARWPWTRACPSTGCFRARIEPAGNDARIVLSFQVDVPYPVSLLVGCRQLDPV